MNEEIISHIAGVLLVFIIIGCLFAGLSEFGIIKPYWWK